MSSKARQGSVEAWKYKTQSCATFDVMGVCPYEGRCMFAHGADELRTIAANRAEGVTSAEGIRRYRKKREKQRIALLKAQQEQYSNIVYTHNPYGFKCCPEAVTSGELCYPFMHPCFGYSTAPPRISTPEPEQLPHGEQRVPLLRCDSTTASAGGYSDEAECSHSDCEETQPVVDLRHGSTV